MASGRRAAWLICLVVLFGVLVAGTAQESLGAWVAANANTGNQFSTASSFSTYPASVIADGAWAYHREEEGPSSNATLAADSTSNSHPGMFSGTTNGPAMWWTFSEGSGTTAADSSGGAGPGTLIGSPTWSTGPSGGGALTFNGGTSYVAGTSGVVHTTTSYTVSAWVRLVSTALDGVLISQNGSHTYGFCVCFDSASKRWAFKTSSADVASPTVVSASYAAQVTAGRWYHVAGVYDASGQQALLYVDGGLAGSVSDPASWDATGALQVGRGLANNAWTGYLNGSVADVRVYPRALSAGELSLLSAGQPVAQWDFPEGSGATTADSGPIGDTGSLVNTSWVGGHAGSGLSFNGTSSVVAGMNGALVTTGSFTVSAWAYLTAKTSKRTIVSQDGTNVSGFYLRYDPGVDKWVFLLYDSDSAAASTANATSTTTPAMNTWYNVAGVYDSGAQTMKIYVNGSLENTGSRTASWAATGAFAVGRGLWNGAGADWAAGTIDGVRAYQRALSASEIAALAADPVPTTNLKASWDFAEGSGSTTADGSGNNNVGSLSNAGWTTAGHASTAVSFNGSNSAVTGVNALLTTNSSFSVAAWVYLTAKSTWRKVISQDGAQISGFNVQYDSGLDRWSFERYSSDSTGATAATSHGTSSPSLNTWYHLAGVYDSSAQTITLYINGSAQTSTSFTSPWNATGAFAVGRGRWNGSNVDYFPGTIDSVRAYQKALSASDITTLMTDTAPATAFTEATMSLGIPGALQGTFQGLSGSSALGFAAGGSGVRAYNNTSLNNPTTFTIECWFRVSGSSGGEIIGFHQDKTDDNNQHDRSLYLDSGGKLTFATNPGSPLSVRSTSTYNDGNWHYTVASLGAAGMKLYVDGALVASNPGSTTAGNYTGYWHWGGGTLSGMPNAPTSGYLTGSIDEVAFYPTQLTDSTITLHYLRNY